MADLTVDAPAKLGEFLQDQASLQPWRVPLLITAGAIAVVRGVAALTPLSAATQLLKGDKVSVASPLPAVQAAAADFRDYCFVPGTDSASATLGKIMEAQPQSKRLTSMTDLESFLDALSGKEITNPIRHIYIGSHANDDGDLFMKVDAASNADPIDFETLVVAEKSKKLAIDPALLDPRPTAGGVAVPAQFRVRGCRIGRAKPFLDQLKKALGGTIPVNAPKHFEHVAGWTKPDGLFEYLDYDFVLRRPKPFMSNKEAVMAFAAAGLTDLDKNPIKPAMIQAGIPANIKKESEQSAATPVEVPFAANALFQAELSFRYHHQQFRTSMNGFPLDPDPVKYDGRKAALRTELETATSWPTFAPSHLFPEWMRLGYKDMAEFMDGYQWSFRYDAKTKTLFFNGDRHVYDLIVPITESGNRKLICNFYPTGSQGAVYEALKPDDQRLYETS